MNGMVMFRRWMKHGGSHCPWTCEVVGKVVLRVALCNHRCIRRHTFYASDRFHFLYSLARCIYIYLLRSTRSFPGLAMTLAWAGGIFIRYCKEDTCYTLVDLYCTFDSYIVYCGSSKKVLTALLTLADCVGSLNRLSAVSRFSPR